MTKKQENLRAESLEDLLEDRDKSLRTLFVKVMNLHAGFQIEEKTPKQLVDAVRQEIEKSVSEIVDAETARAD